MDTSVQSAVLHSHINLVPKLSCRHMFQSSMSMRDTKISYRVHQEKLAEVPWRDLENIASE